MNGNQNGGHYQDRHRGQIQKKESAGVQDRGQGQMKDKLCSGRRYRGPRYHMWDRRGHTRDQDHTKDGGTLGAKYLCFFLLSFPQNERKMY